MKREIPFGGADILLPDADFYKWSVVACDQYTSEPEYWEKAVELVGDAPSSLKLILPEVYLEREDVPKRIAAINRTMDEYLESGLFREYRNEMILTERTLSDGRVRRGLVGAVDLSEYDYREGSRSMIRATEGTVLSRIPPRVEIRRNAPLELPHIMLLIDDPAFTVIPGKAEGTIVYDTELMLGGGRLRGSLLGSEGIAQVQEALARLAADREEPLLFAVGDGNHSLATAKACATAQNPLSRHALVEVVNIHDPSLLFEPIYRVVFGVNPEELIAAAKRQFSGCTEHAVSCLFGGERDAFSVDGLAAGSLQTFLDAYLRDKKGASCDYIHGTAAVEKLSSAENAVGFLFDGIGKEELFRFVERSGSLPRKTFSMGEAQDKRYYMECRRIALP